MTLISGLVEEESEPQRPARRRSAWIAASALTVLLGAGGLWAFRVPITAALIDGWLADAGVAGSFEIERVDFGGVALSSVALGAPEAPDFIAARAEAHLRWAPLPQLGGLRLVDPRLRARIDENGYSLGALDALIPSRPGPARRVRLPDAELEISGARAEIETPFGQLLATLESQGRLGRDFSARGAIAAAQDATLEGVEGALQAQSTRQGLSAALSLAAARGESEGLSFENLNLSATFAAASDFADADSHAQLTLARLAGPLRAGELSAELDLRTNDPTLRSWRGAARASARDAQDGPSHIGAGSARFGANIVIRTGSRESVLTAMRLQASGVALTRDGRAALARAWPELGVLPIGPLLVSARDATLAALEDAAIDVPLRAALVDGQMRIAAAAPLSLSAASGARVGVAPEAFEFIPGERPHLSGGAMVTFAGGGFPDAVIRVARVRTSEAGQVLADGALQIPDWRANGAALSARDLPFRFAQGAEGGRIVISGPALMSGPLAGAASVRDLSAPLNLAIEWGAALRVAPLGDACMTANFAELTLPGLVFYNGSAPLCAESAGYFVSGREAGVSGGVSIAALALDGHMQGDAAQRAHLTTARLAARFSGTGERLVLDAAVEAPSLAVQLAPDRTLTADGDSITMQLVAADGSWRAAGELTNATIDDATLPANVLNGHARFTVEPRGDQAVIRFADGSADLTDRAPPGAESGRIEAFRAMRAVGVRGTLADGRLHAEGALILQEGERAVGLFEAVHVLETGVGEANVRTDDLRFSPGFQPHHLSAMARGVVANVAGPVEAEAQVRWSPDTLTSSGRVRTQSLSFSSATLPIVENVTGEIVFDDLFGLTTPPRQRVTVARINPGVEVHNGVIEFQLKQGGVVDVQRAEWPFAGGVLSIRPTQITLGAEETRFDLVLADVDVAVLLAQLNVPDLVATGHVAGNFPLILTQESARIENGTLRADERGGQIYYAGAAAREATGVARLAFQALGSFRYDDLSLELNGDLDGELVTAINFSGRNAGDLDVGAGAGGPLQASVAGVPFIFNVRIVAPFRRLGEMAAGAFDPRRAIQQAGQSSRDGETPPPPSAVDPPRPPSE